MKKIIITMLITCLIIFNITLISAKTYTDIKISDWYYDYVKTLILKGGINGYEDNTFRPHNTITNAEFIKLIVRSTVGEQAQGTEHWSDNYIIKAREVGLIDYGEWENLDEPINRQNMARIVTRTLSNVFAETEISDTSSYTNTITDWDNIDESYKPFIAQVVAKGIITGYDDRTFSGTRTATRAEVSAILIRLIDMNYRPEWGIDTTSFEERVVRLTNQKRVENGLNALTINWELSQIARLKSQDMHDNGYFSHTSPTYGSPFDMMKSFGINYKSAGENIAQGQKTPYAVVEAWWNSPGHKANILNLSFTQIGVGYVSNNNYWTQMFMSQ